MQLTRTTHPPGGATALIATTGGPAIYRMGFMYVVTPVLLGTTLMLAVAVIVENIQRRYPVYWIKPARKLTPPQQIHHHHHHHYRADDSDKIFELPVEVLTKAEQDVTTKTNNAPQKHRHHKYRHESAEPHPAWVTEAERLAEVELVPIDQSHHVKAMETPAPVASLEPYSLAVDSRKEPSSVIGAPGQSMVGVPAPPSTVNRRPPSSRSSVSSRSRLSSESNQIKREERQVLSVADVTPGREFREWDRELASMGGQRGGKSPIYLGVVEGVQEDSRPGQIGDDVDMVQMGRQLSR
ncbi:hypothetical protein HDU93_009716 [Gonapodya sp. JEL0774]|nr:hypothetical protein HDU93_009716 [Gonapodya sp. JEL0774]